MPDVLEIRRRRRKNSVVQKGKETLLRTVRQGNFGEYENGMSKPNIEEELRFAEIERDRFERLFEKEKEDRSSDREQFEIEIKRLKEAAESDLRWINQVSEENKNLATKVSSLERTLDNYIRG